jgi:hypothetical protein
MGSPTYVPRKEVVEDKEEVKETIKFRILYRLKDGSFLGVE